MPLRTLVITARTGRLFSSSINMEDLPDDIFFNILPRLPIKSLMRFRSVSKHWRNMIDNPLLAHIHLNDSAEKPSLTIIAHPRKSDSTTFYLVNEDEMKLIKTTEIATRKLILQGSCNGLLCFATRYSCTSENILICNPLKNNEIITLTTESSRRSVFSTKMYGLGYSPSANEYKLLHVSLDLEFQTKIYSFSTKLWKDIVSKPPYPIYGRPVYANGALHWKINTFSASFTTDSHMVSFDMAQEVYEIISHPQLGSEKNGMIDVIELQGNLCLVDCSFSAHIDIWMLKDCKKKQWVREYSITVKAFDGRIDNGHAKVIGLWNQGKKICFCLNNSNYLSYDPTADMLEYHNLLGFDPGSNISEVFGNTGSLLSPTMMACLRA